MTPESQETTPPPPSPAPSLPGLAAGLLGEGRAVRIVARGGSMTPFIRDGEPVLLEPLRSPPRRGEVVFCRGPGGALVLHRIVRLGPLGAVTRGDAVADDDGPVAAADLLGRAVAVSGRRRLHLSPRGGRLVVAGTDAARRLPGPLRRLAGLVRRIVARL